MNRKGGGLMCIYKSELNDEKVRIISKSPLKDWSSDSNK